MSALALDCQSHNKCETLMNQNQGFEQVRGPVLVAIKKMKHCIKYLLVYNTVCDMHLSSAKCLYNQDILRLGSKMRCQMGKPSLPFRIHLLEEYALQEATLVLLKVDHSKLWASRLFKC